MKKFSSLTVVVPLLILMLLFVRNMQTVNSLKKQIARQSTITNFEIRQMSNNNPPVDSIYAKGDTIFFYKSGKLKGSTVTTTVEK